MAGAAVSLPSRSVFPANLQSYLYSSLRAPAAEGEFDPGLVQGLDGVNVLQVR
jgi:hypothetical protein